ncbi:far upstream element-binding protein 3 isoform X1 [Onthophagus taurus]|uniref:far upstream element-binding protein 3 isoform X1 n=1 Tax=Onthophagus taurus TaxID=166361 RepID=UPI0039BE22ED
MMSDYSAVAPPPQQNFNQSTAFAAALQRAKQIAAKINPSAGGDGRQKRPLEDIAEPDPKKVAGPGLGVQGGNNGPGGRPNQGGPMNASGGSSGGMGGPPPMGGGGPPKNEDIKVPDKMVGLIIGRGGEQITRLQAESGCKIQMAPDSQGMPERICSLSGTWDAIVRAKELIMNIVQQRGRSEGLGGLDLGSGLGHNNFQGNMNNQQMGGGGGGGGGRNFVEIMVPGPKVGLIIGKGGETIKQLQEKSGAKMVVIQDGPNQEQEKPLRISGDPAKVEYAKQLVYDLIAEKEMQAYNRRGGGGGGGGNGGMNRGGGMEDRQYDQYGGNSEAEVLVPRAAVGVVIGKGGDMIKKIQQETGAKVQFQQAREEGPGERRCYLSGKPQQVDQARQRIEELIDSVHRRDTDGNGGGGGRGSGSGRGGRERYDNRQNNRNNNQDYGGGNGWDDRRQQQPAQEVTFTVPSSKCGVIIGRGGETIKHINQQSGAHCELDRRSQNNQNSSEKTFTIRGDPEQIETAKRIINDKVQMQINYITLGMGGSNNLPTAYPGMAPQGYNPQGWGSQGYQQQWGNNPAPQGPEGGNNQNGNTNVPGMGGQNSGSQPDYSLQWAEYYRSLGMVREAEMIEQQAKNKTMGGQNMSIAPTVAPQNAPNPIQQQQQQQQQSQTPANGAQPDYSAQWAEYYRSMGKLKEAEAIEAQMKAKQGQPGGQAAPVAAAMPGQGNGGNSGYQPYQGGYQAPAQNQYGGFSGYGYSGGSQSGNQDN